MVKLSNAEIQAILQKEIDWCLEHPDKELSQDYQEGFIGGLKQAQFIINAANKAISSTTGTTL